MALGHECEPLSFIHTAASAHETPKALANCSLGHRPRDPDLRNLLNAKSVRERYRHIFANAFSVWELPHSLFLGRCPRLKLANAFGVISPKTLLITTFG